MNWMRRSRSVIASNGIVGGRKAASQVADAILADGWISEGKAHLEGDTLTVSPPGIGDGVTLSVPDILAGNYVLLRDADRTPLRRLARQGRLDPPSNEEIDVALAATWRMVAVLSE